MQMLARRATIFDMTTVSPHQRTMDMTATLSDSWQPAWRDAVLPVLILLAATVSAEESRVSGKVIRGTVVDQQRKAISRAKLWYEYAYSRRDREHLSVSTRSDAEGKFTLEVPPLAPDGKWFARADADIWAFSPKHCLASVSPRHPESKKDASGLRIELAPASDSSVVVLDPQGNPVAGVIVEPTNYRTRRGYDVIPEAAKPLVGARTDDNGRARLPWLARDRMFNVWVTTKKYGVQTQRFTVKADQPAERVVRLRPVCRIQGRVIAAKPEWARENRLVFTTEENWKQGGARPPWPTEGHADVTTDEDGRFEIPVIAAGRLSMLDTVIDETLPVRLDLPERGELPAGETTVFELPMLKLVDIRGSILAEDTGEPLKGIKVHVYYGKMRQGTDVVSNAKGQFSARVLPGRVRFQPMNLHSTNYLQFGSPRPQQVSADANGFELPPIKVVPSKPVDGRLVDEDGAPVAQAEVIAYYRNWLCSAAKTERDGRFTLPKMPTAVKPEEASYRVVLGVGETRYMRDDGVAIIEGESFSLRVRR